MDYGESALFHTIDVCRDLGIPTVGAGEYLEKACSPLIIEVNELKVGIIGRCETQFGVASSVRPGVSALDSTVYSAITHLKKRVDIVILSIHGASEMCPWPSPKWQDLLRSYIDVGCNIVHGHHAHVPQGYEDYNGGVIFYGLGNFLVSYKEWQAHPNTLWSVIAELDIDSSTDFKQTIKTSVIDQAEESVLIRQSTSYEFQNHLDYLAIANKPLQNRTLLTGLWQESAIRMYYLWYSGWLGFAQPSNRFTNSVSVRLFLGKLKNSLGYKFARIKPITKNVSPSRQQLLTWYHLFACESHCEAIVTALGVLGGELDDLRTTETKAIVDKMMPWSTQ